MTKPTTQAELEAAFARYFSAPNYRAAWAAYWAAYDTAIKAAEEEVKP